ncbi:hypothetical protein DM01DRAFT_1333221 [Hesseltinella vesiculosa]|uniref:Uncharacterized protein n=1 Tax=Hesseltinella vesiculosa TaxID=101127 RepID=A0A1X2GRJ4_9FUNG|nr:hypothetical protein DM01DRAFT_1333221 [Hesseltinella vesiculosa]
MVFTDYFMISLLRTCLFVSLIPPIDFLFHPVTLISFVPRPLFLSCPCSPLFITLPPYSLKKKKNTPLPISNKINEAHFFDLLQTG